MVLNPGPPGYGPLLFHSHEINTTRTKNCRLICVYFSLFLQVYILAAVGAGILLIVMVLFGRKYYTKKRERFRNLGDGSATPFTSVACVLDAKRGEDRVDLVHMIPNPNYLARTDRRSGSSKYIQIDCFGGNCSSINKFLTSIRHLKKRMYL